MGLKDVYTLDISSIQYGEEKLDVLGDSFGGCRFV
jgi:hypothetical protein